jgi:DNA-binding NarL/FixJ family response regulator
MPDLGGVEVLRRLAVAGRPPHFVVLTTFDDSEVLLEAAKSGAQGFMLKDVSLEQLALAIRTVAEGRSFMQPSITDNLLRNLQCREAAATAGSVAEALSGREAEVVRLMAGGFSNREIGEILGLAEGTVKNHVSRLLLKLDARDRTNAVLKAITARLA